MANNNIPERKYVADIIFNEFLGLEYELEIGSENYEISLENGSQIIFEDSFFNLYPQDGEYLELDNIPTQTQYVSNRFLVQDDIPVIFGNSKLEHNNATITCGIDIFASSFFMLSRWEEYVNKKRDSHNRFPARESLAFKCGFLGRPIVNEYVELLKAMMIQLDSKLVFNTKSRLFITHDVDRLYMWKNWKHISRRALGDVLKRRDLRLAVSRFVNYFKIRVRKMKDPFDTFDWMMSQNEKTNSKSYFYFMSGGTSKYDNRYKINEPRCLELIDQIKERGHVIGFHPSYDSYNDTEQFRKEKDALEKVTKSKVTEGRQHYLRFEVPTTWQIWEDNGMKIDSTCGYADKEGFRCGTGNEFSVFNILSREKLFLKERPLILMEGTIFGYQDINEEENIKNIISWNKITDIVVLWHNSSLHKEEIRKAFLKLFERV